jgi:beta-glucosidase
MLAHMLAEAATLVARLTREEKVALLSGADFWHTAAVPRLGIPALRMSDGPNGVRGTRFTTGPPSALVPCGAALGASWDPDVVREVGGVLADEARAKNVHLLLGPTMNLQRTPVGGRNFEAFSEDPHLTARLAVAYVEGVQAKGVACCAKHLVANDTEWERMTADARVDERTLREVLLAPFEAVVREAGARCVMASYNRLNGTYASEHPWLLRRVLREDWGFDGAVVSDWFATHTTTDALLAGLDLEMPGPPLHRGRRLLEAVRAGEVAEHELDEAAGHVLELVAWAGLLGTEPDRGEHTRRDPGAAAALRHAAAAGMVLLRNEGGLLPLDRGGLGRVALIGPNADAAALNGGGSAALRAERRVAPRDGLAARITDLVVEPGCLAHRALPPLDERDVRGPDGEPGVLVEHLGAGGALVATETVARSAAHWGGGEVPEGTETIRLRATLTPRASGEWIFGVAGVGPSRLWLDERLVVANDGRERGDALMGFGSTEARAAAELQAGTQVELRAEVEPAAGSGLAGLIVGALPPTPADLLDRAVAAAAGADVAVVVVGTNEDWETEGVDRASMALPGDQDELVRRVAEANPRTVVVVNAGSPVAMDWADSVPAVLQIWFAGQELGHALADVLLGDAEPGGRLPLTIPHRLQDTPAFLDHPGEAGVLRYSERGFTGHRWYDARDLAPRFPFGHGLGYTTFAFQDAELEGDAVAGDLAVALDVVNTGPREGKAVVQVYLEAPPGPLRRPPRALAGFAPAVVAPGARERVRVPVSRRAFEVWDPQDAGWRLPPGRYRLRLGRSSRDLVASLPLDVEPHHAME